MTGPANSERPLAGRMALVTGATGAIAIASARELARGGADLALMGRRADGVREAANALRAEVPDANIHEVTGDAADETAVKDAVRMAVGAAGRLDIIFATVGGGGFRPLIEAEAGDLRDAFETNVISAFHAIRHGAPEMRAGGSIICLSSGAAALTFRHLAAYHVAKAALEGLVRMAADELGPSGIRVNAVRPGLTRSGATDAMFEQGAAAAFLPEYPLGRLGEPADIAGAVRFLAGDESAWVTGQCIAVDGGNLLRRSPDLAPLPPVGKGGAGPTPS